MHLKKKACSWNVIKGCLSIFILGFQFLLCHLRWPSLCQDWGHHNTRLQTWPFDLRVCILLKHAKSCTAQISLQNYHWKIMVPSFQSVYNSKAVLLCYYFTSAFSMSFLMSRGEVVGAYLFTGTPCLSQRNFVKFHLMLFVSVPCFAFFRKT